MTLVRAISAELRKTLSLPATLVALGIAVLGSLGLTGLNARFVREAITSGRTDGLGPTSAAEVVFSAVPLGTVGAIILGVTAISSEYTPNSPDVGGSRQVTATLTALTRRFTVVVAKVVSVVALIAPTAAVTMVACLALARGVMGGDVLGRDTVARSLGVVLYWTLTALIAVAITLLARSGIVPLIVLIANTSLVSVSLLLTKVTSLAYWLPDLAGLRLFASDPLGLFDDALEPFTGGLVMSAWAVGLLAIGAVVFSVRDA